MLFKAILVTLLLVGTATVVVARRNAAPTHADHPARSVTVYKTPTCGCCGNYVSYLRTKNYEVEVIDLEQEELTAKKTALGIPSSLDSCHTTVDTAGDYFVEGHIPYEAVEKLLSEKPSIKGIGMPGMPAASPGMPGTKDEPFVISQVDNDGNLSNYLTL